MDDREITQQLQQASQGLLWLSESDYPFEIIYWQGEDNLAAETILQHCDHDSDTIVEIVTLEQFFHLAICEQDWHDQKEKEEVYRYQALVKLLQEKLTNIKVYRVGEIEIDVYILGKTKFGSISGLATKVIET